MAERKDKKDSAQLMKRQISGMREYLHASKRNRIETVFSVIAGKMPRILGRAELGGNQGFKGCTLN